MFRKDLKYPIYRLESAITTKKFFKNNNLKLILNVWGLLRIPHFFITN